MNSGESTVPLDTETNEETAQAADAQPRGLTRRQRRVLTWLVEGKSLADIADRLDRDEEQLGMRIRELLAGLGVDSPEQALELKDLPEPDDEAPRRAERRRRGGEAKRGSQGA